MLARKPLFRIIAASAICLFWASPTLSQTASSETIEEIVVAAKRQHYRGDVPVEDLPQSVQVLTEDTLKQVGAVKLNDALDLVSGVARQNTFGGVWDSFAIRGFAGNINVPAGYLVNGFNSGRGFGGVRDTSSIERIEVLKGPGSALFGRGEPGGTVAITTKKPQFEAQGSVDFTAGSYSFLRAEVDYTGPLSDSVAFRINGAYEDADSFRDTVHTKRQFASPSILFNISEDTRLWYELEYSRQELPFDRGTVARNGELGIIPNSRYLGEPGDGPNIAKVLGHQLEAQHHLGGDWIVLLGAAYRDTDLVGFGQNPDLSTVRNPFLDPDNAAGISSDYLTRQRRFHNYKTSDTVLRAEISGQSTTGSVTHHLLFGVDFEEFELDRHLHQWRASPITDTSTITTLNAINIFDPDYGLLVDASIGAPNVSITGDDIEKQESYGIYLTDQMDLSERLSLRLGARFDSYKQSFTQRRVGVATPPTQDLTTFSPQVGLIFKAKDTLSFYTTYAEGFRPNNGADFQNRPFEQEETSSFEVGLKFSNGSGTLTGNTAVYYMEKSNVLTADPINVPFSIAVGEAVSKGVEFDISGELPGDVWLTFSYAYTDAYVASDGFDPVLFGAVSKGDPLLNVPKHNANVLVLKDILVGGRTLTLGAGAKYFSRRLGQLGTALGGLTSPYYLPAYTLVRLQGSYQVTDRLRITGEVTNLFDEQYYPASFYSLWTAVGAPRQYQLRATWDFFGR